QTFEVRKRFRFEPGEYLIQVDIELVNSVNEFVPLNFEGMAYTLTYGPQIGPEFEASDLDGRNEFRRFETLTQDDGLDRETYEGLQPGETELIEQRVLWAGIGGKYFAALGATDSTRYRILFENRDVSGLAQGNFVHFTRPEIRSSRNTDTFRFYTGPKTEDVLTRYNSSADNGFGISGMHFEETQDIRPILGWLETILKWGLNFFYSLIPNYGVAIILLTIVVKGLLYPLTRKSFTSMRRMQELQPKINEIREKYKNDQQKMNQAMAEFYKKEKVNPLGGCLPLLLQIPFFIAMFGVFHNSFDLRGATFIAGWINDLSASESILSWSGFALPVIGNDIRLLPIIFLATQMFTSKFMQSGAAGSSTQQKLMKYALPAFIFFVLYNMPAGLLVYMILTNLVTGLQQWSAAHKASPTT
ncbi:MAG: YidC/Oxa1 family insertase periplasmic-domain containing protein, partial [Spirochaetota bacterium]